MNQTGYAIYFYKNTINGKLPVKDYIDALPDKQKAKILKYIEFLRVNKGYLDEPYSKHIMGKIRELRVDFGRDRHRIFYFTFVEQKIILLHAFLKRTQKAPEQEVQKAQNNYNDFITTYGKKT